MTRLKILLFTILILKMNIYATSVVNSKHNLSLSGPGPIKSSTESRICVFCHIPHNASPDGPLWHHTLSVSNYYLYSSSTLDSTMNQPSGSSKLCLSCHDGTIALGSTTSRTLDMSGAPDLDLDLSFASTATGYLGTVLSDDHPVSFTRNAADTETHDPPGGDPVKLDGSGLIQCISCHDPHDNQYGYFLVKNNISAGIGSQICLTCHVKSGWMSNPHRNATTVTYTGGPRGPFGTGTVAEYGCEGCHDPHSADEYERLLDEDNPGATKEENVCYNCHEGTIASDIQGQFLKASRHDVQNYDGVHSPTEANSPGEFFRHIECVDCHNPHQTGNVIHTIGANDIPLGSVIENVKGIQVTYGAVPWTKAATYTPVTASKEYEICFRCHSRNSSMFTASMVDERGNMDVYFNPNNTAHHAVVSAGPQSNPNMDNTLTNVNRNSTIYCSDCHGDDAINSPSGPHGSDNNWLLAGYNGGYVCYKCHKEEVYSGSGGSDNLSKFPEHNRAGHHTTSGLPPGTPSLTCFMCHGDFSTGVSGAYIAGGIHGAESANMTWSPDGQPIDFLNGVGLQWVDNGDGTASCGDWDNGTYGCSQHSDFGRTYNRNWW